MRSRNHLPENKNREGRSRGERAPSVHVVKLGSEISQSPTFPGFASNHNSSCWACIAPLFPPNLALAPSASFCFLSAQAGRQFLRIAQAIKSVPRNTIEPIPTARSTPRGRGRRGAADALGAVPCRAERAVYSVADTLDTVPG